MMNTQDFGPVRIRAFGKYSIKVADPMKLLKSIVGTSGHFTVEGIMEQLRAEIVQKFADQLAERKMPVMDMASQYVELSKLIGDQMRADFVEQYGLSLTRMVIENITLPEEVEKALDERGKMAALGNLDQYTKMKTAEAIGDAAKNPGGLAGAGAGLGAGIVMAQQMQQAMNAPTPPAPSATVNCPSCGKASSTGNFCQHCGKPLAASAMCKACQKAVPSGSKFCPDCGAKIV
jgi:membrane protease subunit (stomatin/prohibitin family)